VCSGWTTEPFTLHSSKRKKEYSEAWGLSVSFPLVAATRLLQGKASGLTGLQRLVVDKNDPCL
jgi:hypothetical protein